MNTKLVNSAAGVILAALEQNRTAAGIALALDSARLLLTPETTGELKQLQDLVAELETQRERRSDRLVALENDALNMRGVLSPNGEERKVPMPLGETLTPAVEWLVGRVAELEKVAFEARGALAALCHDLEDPGSNALGALFLLQQATVWAPMERGETVPTIYRASHDSIVMGLYLTAAEARAHCVAEERRTWSPAAAPVFDWIEDEEDGVAELVTVAEDGETETVTGYVVTALEVASKYDPDADE